MNSVGITTDCVCDLPGEYLRANGVDLVDFYITTDTGRFKDGCEITSENILEYLEEGGGKAETNAPDAADYQAFFEKRLERYGEIVHLSTSSHIGFSYQNAMSALEGMGEAGKRVTVVDSEQLSTGMGHLVMRAVEMRDAGSEASEIVKEIISLRKKVSMTFITQSVAPLYRFIRIGPRARRLCAFFAIRPVLCVRNGRISLKSFRIGNDEKSVIRHVRSELKRGGQINGGRLFITHAGCTVKMIAQIRAEAERLRAFDEVVVTQASATVSVNCGPGTVGVVFIQK